MGDETAPARGVRCSVTVRTIKNDNKAELGKSKNCRIPER